MGFVRRLPEDDRIVFTNMPSRSQIIAKACAHLSRQDAVLRRIIHQVGPFRLKLKRDRFATLVHSIVAQQVSGKAAKAILGRLQARLAPARIGPAALAALSFEELRAVGLSRQKASYLQDLAAKTVAGEIHFRRFARLNDEEVIAELVKIRGVGRWTAEMLLIFSLGRLDVLPCDDFGIRSALRRLYQLDDLPNRATCHAIAEPWRPYASIASWYCWRSLELPS